MTQDRARKNDIRERMAQTGEPYNVARRALEDTTSPTQGSHLITDEETCRIAELFISSSPWHGDVVWDDIVVGPFAGWLSDGNGNFKPSTELPESHRWSWRVTFVDPSGDSKMLTHELVLQGLRELIYREEEQTGVKSIRLRGVRQWFTEPAAERRNLALSSSDASRICQHALYGRQVFPSDDDHLFGKKLDFFSEQRTPHNKD